MSKDLTPFFIAGIVMSFLVSCSTTSETRQKEDLLKWVGSYFYGGDGDGMGIILTIDTVGSSIKGSLSDGSDPQVISLGEDGSVFVGGHKASLLNDTIRFSVVYSEGDTTNYSLPRVTEAWIASLMQNNEKIKDEKKYVKIGSQVWMAADLRTQTYSNGEAIPQAQSSEEWRKCNENKIGCWCYFNNDKNQNILYNWYAVTDNRGLAPNGWKIPSMEDFMQLAEFLGGEGDAGIQMKSEGFHPPRDNDGSLNFSRFSAVGTGYREPGWKPGEFRGKTLNGAGEVVFYWTSSFDMDHWNNPKPRTVGLYLDSRRLHKNPLGTSVVSGLTVRLIKSNESTERGLSSVSAKLIYDDGSLSDFDIINDKSVVLWNTFASEGERKASKSVRYFINGNASDVEIKISNDSNVLLSRAGVEIHGSEQVDVAGTGCGNLSIQISKEDKVIYTKNVEFGCGE